MRWILPIVLIAKATFAAAAPPADCVVLLHGLARTEVSFLVMEEALAAEGYATVNSDYDSTAAPIETLAATAVPEAIAACPVDAPKIHVVTHSMGGILMRQWMANAPPPDLLARLGRTVMLAPPNQGSELVNTLAGLAPFDWINGPAGAQLGTDGLPSRLGPVWPGVGIIAGDRSLNPVYSRLLPGPDDGKVSVASTRVDGMDAHLTLPLTHTFLMNSPLVVGQVLTFLRQGRFDPDLDMIDVLGDLAD
ncbi:acetyltransferase [Jannaschia pagri]|uniref:Acetyltransferase n=1 Tax=Jannaschia pagri TaxID=2829797 RepID=A0ABQ4NKK6_9RHOB|nr:MULTISPECIES: alpha/beta fold hydrolase [unclassified Jannaschia]GIT91105.1 acetyltransferase [Jannaschia sp. AI_61]GIT94937.1 acetyltransferase [Jannaschia sp. AI_62]